MKGSLIVLIAILACLSAACDERPAGGTATDEQAPRQVMVSGEGVRAAEPAVARDASGAVFVVYVEHSDKNADVILQRLDASGKSDGSKVRVNPEAGTAKAWKGDPPTIAIGADNTVFVGWTRQYANGGKGTDLIVSASRDGGRTFGEPVKVNDDAKPASHGMHSLAVGKDGRLFAAWLDERNIKEQPHDMSKMGKAAVHHEAAESNSEVFYSYSTDGGKTFASNKKIASEVCPCCKTSLLAADDGTVYAAWRQVLEGDHRHIAVASSVDSGATFSQGMVVSDDKWQISACPVSGAALASSAAGTLDVIWYTAGDAGQAGVYFTRSTDAGKTFAKRVLLSNEGRAGTLALIQQNGKSVATFPTIDGHATATWAGLPTESVSIKKTPQAALPAATNGITSFVRETNGKSEVWLVVRPAV